MQPRLSRGEMWWRRVWLGPSRWLCGRCSGGRRIGGQRYQGSCGALQHVASPDSVVFHGFDLPSNSFGGGQSLDARGPQRSRWAAQQFCNTLLKVIASSEPDIESGVAGGHQSKIPVGGVVLLDGGGAPVVEDVENIAGQRDVLMQQLIEIVLDVQIDLHTRQNCHCWGMRCSVLGMIPLALTEFSSVSVVP